MAEAQKEKESFSVKYQFEHSRSESGSKNDVKAVNWSIHVPNLGKYVWQSTKH